MKTNFRLIIAAGFALLLSGAFCRATTYTPTILTDPPVTGAANESGQAVLAYTVSSVSNAALFSAAPSVATNGTLTYTPAANANGTSTFQVRVQDNGGVALGGIDTSDPQTFTITVNAVNDPPVITGQAALSTAFNTARSIALADLIVTDVDNTCPTGFTLSILDGTNYTRSGNTITPALNFFGTLSVLAKVNGAAADANGRYSIVDIAPPGTPMRFCRSTFPQRGDLPLQLLAVFEILARLPSHPTASAGRPAVPLPPSHSEEIL